MTSVQEAIILSSDDEIFPSLADDRPPSDDDYASSITLSSGEDSDSQLEDIENVTNGEAENHSTEPNQPIAKDNEKEKGVTTEGKKGTRPRNGKSSQKKKKGDKTKRKRKKASERRNIRKIITEGKLDENTVNAQKEEEDRKKRLAERAGLPDAPHLKSLLQDTTGVPRSETPQDTYSHDVVELSSSDDDCMIVDHDTQEHSDVEEEEDNTDPENSGIHVDDSKNKRDSKGRVLVNVAHPNDDPDLFLSPQLARVVKAHQIGGIRFLYDNLVESLQRFRHSSGFGCILAHSMGLGKTCQVVSFTDVFMRCTDARRVLIIVPINTLQNWINEFDMWLPDVDNLPQGISKEEITPRTFKLLIINDTHKTVGSRAKVIGSWTREGGVLLMGYEMFRLLASRKTRPKKRKANAAPELIDIDLEEKNSGLQLDMQQALLDPGPDLVICDEGHRIKNSHAGISKTLKQINTKRRVVLTGYPLQNNLTEYWCMVDFVRPNFLGTKVEFSNMFERPISNGQCADSTPQDVKLMRYRAHVLHNLLEGFVQRRNHNVLMANLPPKAEWVIMVRMSQAQRTLYNMFMENLSLEGESCIGGTNPLKAFAVACKIWNHPDVMSNYVDKHTDQDLDFEVGLTNGSLALTNNKGTKRMKKSSSESALSLKVGTADSPLSTLFAEKTAEITYDWVKPAFESYLPGVIENSGKFVLLFQIIEETLQLNEKLLVFSQSLMTLNLLEEYLSKMSVPIPGLNETWTKNYSYFRLDGATNASDREKLIKQFNSADNLHTHLFLLSTKAGCLGINLVGANRVVMLDASWNPCHDCQAVCRVYRYGQTKPCFIYRFVTDNTMERKIYDRQINKQGMSDRVVDEIQVQNQFSSKENDQLLEYQDRQLPTIDPTGIEEKCFDPVLVKMIQNNHSWITQNPFTHESLLIEAQDQKLTKVDKQLAKEAYEREKKLSVSFSRPSYANYYQNKQPVFRGPTLPPLNPAMPRPAVSTPQMRTPSMPFNYPFDSKPRMVKPGVSVQTIPAHKDISLPGENNQVIKQGIPEHRSASPSVESHGADQMLSSLLQSNRSRQVAPNIVGRRPPETTPSAPTEPSQPGIQLSSDIQPQSIAQSQPLYSPYQDGHMTTASATYHQDTPHNHIAQNNLALSAHNLYSQMGRDIHGNAANSANMPPYDLSGMMSQQFHGSNFKYPFNQFNWGYSPHNSQPANHDPMNMNGSYPPTFQQPQHQQLTDSHSLPNLNHLTNMAAPLTLPLLDQPDSTQQRVYDSDTSLPSFDGDNFP
ncbi:helicase ARIP4-like isoform X2 [Watersipora subatra]|uniref:helicase ARIP4-like isoform X2 n=1 Tax=Watersipora subatra TaxID=2589382 RepID=UPI00355C2BF5